MSPTIDRDALHAQTGGDADLAREVLGLFAGQCRALLPLLADRRASAGERADLAHTLTGSAAGVGALRIGALAAKAEDRLRAGAEPDALVGTLAVAVEETLRAIAEGGFGLPARSQQGPSPLQSAAPPANQAPCRAGAPSPRGAGA